MKLMTKLQRSLPPQHGTLDGFTGEAPWVRKRLRAVSVRAHALQQSGTRRIQSRTVTRQHAGVDVTRQYLAQLNAPLVKAVDAPNGATDKYTVFL